MLFVIKYMFNISMFQSQSFEESKSENNKYNVFDESINLFECQDSEDNKSNQEQIEKYTINDHDNFSNDFLTYYTTTDNCNTSCNDSAVINHHSNSSIFQSCEQQKINQEKEKTYNDEEANNIINDMINSQLDEETINEQIKKILLINESTSNYISESMSQSITQSEKITLEDTPRNISIITEKDANVVGNNTNTPGNYIITKKDENVVENTPGNDENSILDEVRHVEINDISNVQLQNMITSMDKSETSQPLCNSIFKNDANVVENTPGNDENSILDEVRHVEISDISKNESTSNINYMNQSQEIIDNNELVQLQINQPQEIIDNKVSKVLNISENLQSSLNNNNNEDIPGNSNRNELVQLQSMINSILEYENNNENYMNQSQERIESTVSELLDLSENLELLLNSKLENNHENIPGNSNINELVQLQSIITPILEYKLGQLQNMINISEGNNNSIINNCQEINTSIATISTMSNFQHCDNSIMNTEYEKLNTKNKKHTS